MGQKVVKSLLFLVFRAFQYVQFKEKDLHFVPFSLSRLVASSYFSKPNYTLLATKIPLFNHYFAPFGHVFNVSKRFYLYNCCGCVCFLTCIKHLFALHLASFRLVFCTKTHCILHQNAMYLAPKCSAFSGKTPKIWCKWRSF